MVLVAGLRWNKIHRKAEADVYNFCIQGFQSCSAVNFKTS
jgi:hypothetical protein